MSTPVTDGAAFRLVWSGAAYYVSKPGIESVDVVPAFIARELENTNTELRRELESLAERHYTHPDIWPETIKSLLDH